MEYYILMDGHVVISFVFVTYIINRFYYCIRILLLHSTAELLSVELCVSMLITSCINAYRNHVAHIVYCLVEYKTRLQSCLKT